jgi:hypothetical protein
LELLDRERRPLYRELADVVVDVDELAPPDVVERILAATGLGAHAQATRR